jgi:hypothetical protein
LILLEVRDQGEDPVADVNRIHPERHPAIVRIWGQTGVEVEMPGIAMKVGNGVPMDLGRGDDEDWVSEPQQLLVEEGEEVEEVGMGDEPVLEHGEPDVETISRKGMVDVHGALDLEPEVHKEVAASMDVGVAAVVVGCLAPNFQFTITGEHVHYDEQVFSNVTLLHEANRH